MTHHLQIIEDLKKAGWEDIERGLPEVNDEVIVFVGYEILSGRVGYSGPIPGEFGLGYKLYDRGVIPSRAVDSYVCLKAPKVYKIGTIIQFIKGYFVLRYDPHDDLTFWDDLNSDYQEDIDVVRDEWEIVRVVFEPEEDLK